MAIRDLEAFIRERAAQFDSTLDLSPGAPFDKQVIQPLKRRLGTDPFTVDLETFVTTRLQQAYPDMAVDDGDALTDLLVKPAQLLWDPVVREVVRVRQGQSFRDRDVLTEEEADALGANLFAERPKGEYSKGVGRIYFAQAQQVSLTPVNFFTSKSGYKYPPTESQSIRVEEMLLNYDNALGLFYFDVNLIAAEPGSKYDIGPDELSSVANLEAAVRVTNQRRFRGGLDAATAAEFVDSVQQQLTERSLVTLRGIAAKLTNSFPEVTRLNTVGFNDPEMGRDVLRGGGLGAAVAAGTLGQTLTDSAAGGRTARFRVLDAGIDFTQLIGPVGPVTTSMVLSPIGAFAGSTVVDDLLVTRVVSTDILEVATATMVIGRTGLAWTLRRKQLTLSGIPGGILFPSAATGEVTINDNEVHIGGAVDIHVRGVSSDEATLIIDAVADDEPELSGSSATFNSGNTTQCTLADEVLEGTYLVGDSTYALLKRAARDSLSIQIVDGVNAGVYRILSVVQALTQSPVLTVTPAFTSGVAPIAQWRVFDDVNIALTDIKETRIAAGDLVTTQGSTDVTTGAGTDFDALGVSQGDTLRILDGADAGDYQVVEDPLTPGFTSLRLDRTLTLTQSGVQYTVFRANAAGNLLPPLVRVRSIELLDTSNQPLGTTIPYAKPVDIQSRAFQNPARGIKHTFVDTRLGLLTGNEPGGGFVVGGLTLDLSVGTAEFGISAVSITFTAGNKTATEVAAEINAATLAQVSEPSAAVVISDPDGDRVGFRPFGITGYVATIPSSAMPALFGNTQVYTTNDIRSSTAELTGWGNLNPLLDLATGLDVIQFIDGNQVGVVPGPYQVGYIFSGSLPSTALLPVELNRPLNPEIAVRAQVGSRSIGSVRLFFLEPTTFEARTNETYFSLVTEDGLVRFTPDPTLSHQQIPPLPSDVKPMDGSAMESSAVFASLNQDFVRAGILPGDTLVLDYIPLGGTIALADPVPNLVNKTLVFSVDGGPDHELIFIRDDGSIGATEVTRDGVVDQINAAAGIVIARLTNANTLEFEADVSVVIRGTGTANPLILGDVQGTSPTASFTSQQSNQSPVAGEYEIASVDSATQVTLVAAFAASAFSPYASTLVRQQYRVLRNGVQRISTGTMVDNEAEASLYYFDVELVSEGTGDAYNIDADQQLTAEGYRAEGYYLTTEDENLTFSTVERPRLVLSRSILEAGVDDDPTNATQLVGQNIQVTYERSSLVSNVNDYVTAETERTVCSSPLVRFLLPHFVRFDVTYIGGSSEEITVPALENHIVGLSPVEALESSNIQSILTNAGATSIENPLDLIAIVHGVDRSILAHRSQNRLTTGRLAAFLPDVLNVIRRIA